MHGGSATSSGGEDQHPERQVGQLVQGRSQEQVQRFTHTCFMITPLEEAFAAAP